MAQISRVKGTQDFIDLTLYNFVVDTLKEHIALYHFTEISTPILEPLDLFTRSLGEQTDVVTKEMFVIEPKTEETSERICLRPEGTAPTVRTFIEQQPLTPWKVFSYGPMFRYERPQKGRYRQFHQINMEVIGSRSISEDAQFIKMLDRYFHEKLTFNNYALMINFLGTPEDRKSYRVILKKFLDSKDVETICDTCKIRKESNIMRIFDCKNPICQDIYQKAPHIADHLGEESKQEWEQLKKELMMLSVSFVYNPKLVRGLDYYSKTVFEFTSNNLGAQNAFCGGGRYDQLVRDLGAHVDQPSLGAAIGIERVILLLEAQKESLALPQQKALHVVVPLSEKQNPLALLVADTLQAADIVTDIVFSGSISTSMKKANKMGALYAIILGDQEQQNKTAVVKNMVTGKQEEVAQIDLIRNLRG